MSSQRREDDKPERADGPAPQEGPPEVPQGAIVVGVGRSVHDEQCIDWAAGAATRTKRPLHLLRAMDADHRLELVDPMGSGTAVALSAADLAPDAVLDEVLDRARTRWPELDISHSQPSEPPERALVEASRRAYLVVVGATRVGSIKRALLGRPALAVAMHASCPAVIFPEEARTGAEGPVVVAIDGSPGSAQAAERAFWISRTRGAPVRAIATWHVEVVDGYVVTTADTPAWDTVVQRYHSMVEEVLAPLRAEYPEVEVTIEVIRGVAATVLTQVSQDAGLLVMGSRGRGGFRGMLLGSVSHAVLETATCPVMIVRYADA